MNLDEATRIEIQELELLKAQVSSMTARIWASRRTHEDIKKAVQRDREMMIALQRQRHLMLKRKESAMTSSSLNSKASLARRAMSASGRSNRSSSNASPIIDGAAVFDSGSDDESGGDGNSAVGTFELLDMILDVAASEAADALAKIKDPSETRRNIGYADLVALRFLYSTAIGAEALPSSCWNGFVLARNIMTSSVTSIDAVSAIRGSVPELLVRHGELLTEANHRLLRQLDQGGIEMVIADTFVPRALRWSSVPSIVSVSCRRMAPGLDLAMDAAVLVSSMAVVSRSILQTEGRSQCLIARNRVPLCEGADQVLPLADVKHALLCYRSSIFVVDVLTEKGVAYDPHTLARRFDEERVFAATSHNPTPWAFLSLPWAFPTSECKLAKQDWFDARTEITASELDARKLALLESALFVVCVDDDDCDDEFACLLSDENGGTETSESHHPDRRHQHAERCRGLIASLRRSAMPHIVREAPHRNSNRWYLNALNVTLNARTGDVKLLTTDVWSPEASFAELSHISAMLDERLLRHDELACIENDCETEYLLSQLVQCVMVVADLLARVQTLHVVRYVKLTELRGHIEHFLKLCEDDRVEAALRSGLRALDAFPELADGGGDTASKQPFKTAMSFFASVVRLSGIGTSSLDVEVYNPRLPDSTGHPPHPTCSALDFFAPPAASSTVSKSASLPQVGSPQPTAAAPPAPESREAQIARRQFKKRLYVMDRLANSNSCDGSTWLRDVVVANVPAGFARNYARVLTNLCALHLLYDLREPGQAGRQTIPAHVDTAAIDASAWTRRVLCTDGGLVEAYEKYFLPRLIGQHRPAPIGFSTNDIVQFVRSAMQRFDREDAFGSGRALGSPVAHCYALEAAATMRNVEIVAFRDSRAPLGFIANSSTHCVLSAFVPPKNTADHVSVATERLLQPSPFDRLDGVDLGSRFQFIYTFDADAPAATQNTVTVSIAARFPLPPFAAEARRALPMIHQCLRDLLQ